MAGGSLAIEKNWFFELGGYDPGIKIYGGEAYELSFKVSYKRNENDFVNLLNY